VNFFTQKLHNTHFTEANLEIAVSERERDSNGGGEEELMSQQSAISAIITDVSQYAAE
jgi:hypothetical protein